ncbi:MAG: peptide chain release factor N(5)-glutamine methyltransferase [Bacteroidales bacterium]|nr:peptide chain release factor N(5)-glutamine methyltransferase [Candidatus Sodaliphilus limicaballi]
MNVNQALAHIKAELSAVMDAGESQAVARMMMKHYMNYDPVDIILRGDSVLPDFVPEKIESALARLKRNEPIQHVLGKAYFCGRDFTVTCHTLIPRPETEQLVDMIVDENKASDLQVLDIGTGSGCIAISLTLAMKFARVTAIDISAEALAVAETNAKDNKAKVDFIQADALHLADLGCEPLDIVVSNPPYVCDSEKSFMEPNVLDYEPHAALFVPDDDPLRFYNSIARYALRALKPGGRLYFEINRQFGNETAALLTRLGYENVVVTRDSFGNNRFVSATR